MVINLGLRALIIDHCSIGSFREFGAALLSTFLMCDSPTDVTFDDITGAGRLLM
ncbi:MAG: hypothetical protein GX640_24380 [Fibrobacter sp.]|nr:hypothetical protein [Fibrobacter sp.]